MGFLSGLFGKSTGEKELLDLSTEPFEGYRIQRFLPPQLRERFTGPTIERGMAGISELIRNPGGLSPTVSEAILPRLAAESERIGQNFRNIGAQNVGAASRANVPVSIQSALERALDIAQERAQRGARREALSESEQLRRSDTEQVYKLLNIILQFIASGRGQTIPGLGQAAQFGEQRRAGNIATLGSLAGSVRDAFGGIL